MLKRAEREPAVVAEVNHLTCVLGVCEAWSVNRRHSPSLLRESQTGKNVELIAEERAELTKLH